MTPGCVALWGVGQVEREASKELSAVAPLLAGGKVIGSCTFVTSGTQVLGFTSAELLRVNEGAGFAIATRFDLSATVPIKAWALGRYTGIGLVELGAPLPTDHDVQPLPIAAVCASVDTRGAPAALVTFSSSGRVVIPVHVDAVAGMSDIITRLATPHIVTDVAVDGAALFAWFPPDPVLGRTSEVVVVAVGHAYRAQILKPRDQPAVAELMGLDDLGRALKWSSDPSQRVELPPTAGEIEVTVSPAAAPDKV